MTPFSLMENLMECCAVDQDRRDSIHREARYYVAIADLGYDLFSEFLNDRPVGFGIRFLEIIETALSDQDPDTMNLIVAGLFESLQSQNYRQGPDDLIEKRLGPQGLKAWSDLMEGWSGPGVRSVAVWRARAKS